MGEALTNRPNEYSPARIAKYDVAVSHTWMLSTPRFTSDHLNFSSCSAAKLNRSSGDKTPDKRVTANACSSAVKNPALAKLLLKNTNATSPHTIVSSPSMMKIQRHPSRPPRGPMADSPRARSPPKAPDSDAAV